jgi:hypothetical protein
VREIREPSTVHSTGFDPAQTRRWHSAFFAIEQRTRADFSPSAFSNIFSKGAICAVFEKIRNFGTNRTGEEGTSVLCHSSFATRKSWPCCRFSRRLNSTFWLFSSLLLFPI